MNNLTLEAVAVNPTPAVEASDAFLLSEAWWSGFAQGADGFRPHVPGELMAADLVESFRAGHWSGWDNFETEQLTADRLEAEAELLGYELGAEGIEAESIDPDPTLRAAFERGHNAGNLHLRTVDPAFAAHLRERAERASMDKSSTWHDAEVAEVGGYYSLTRV